MSEWYEVPGSGRVTEGGGYACRERRYRPLPPFPFASPAELKRMAGKSAYRYAWFERFGFYWHADGTDQPAQLQWSLYHLAFIWHCRVPDGQGWFDTRGRYCWPWQYWRRYFEARKAEWK